MIINSLIILIGSALLGGFLALKYAEKKKIDNSLILAFSGSYLFAVTCTHILPQLFSSSSNASLYIVAGFFFQQTLEFFTRGVEHGHKHLMEGRPKNKNFALPILVGLSIHALLEGTLLTHSETNSISLSNFSMVFGVGLHKLLATFTMMNILVYQYKSRTKPILFLFLFSLASPLGLLVSQYVIEVSAFPLKTILMALVGGSFIYISTTIIFESMPGHRIKLTNLIMLLLGAGAAIVIEMVV